ncbi:RadC family protein [Oceanobacillus profundus]|uniref:DNA repair protein RadC n=1 Tax=Oceanobacillus profundus TaxID=372463 RepID=A0A417YGQ2_9BACI|nr:DNA repair protein RadC [Oceanobacillus profundus]RHW31932.1 DNA repair protein RadC [Oceanobacillus profundus]
MSIFVKEAKAHYMSKGYEFEHLTNRELLTLIIGQLPKKSMTDDIVSTLIQLDEKIGMLELSYHDLISINGVGEALASRILSSIELGKRLVKREKQSNQFILNIPDAVDYFHYIKHYKQEHFVVLFLDTKHKVIGEKTIFKGSLNACLVHPREVYKEALRMSSASIIIGHNHPSQSPTISPEDIKSTQRMQKAGEVVGIELIDHIVIAGEKYASFREKGYF